MYTGKAVNICGLKSGDSHWDKAAEFARHCSWRAGLGYERLCIVSGEVGLYEKYGFTRLGNFETIYNTAEQLFVRKI